MDPTFGPCILDRTATTQTLCPPLLTQIQRFPLCILTCLHFFSRTTSLQYLTIYSYILQLHPISPMIPQGSLSESYFKFWENIRRQEFITSHVVVLWSKKTDISYLFSSTVWLFPNFLLLVVSFLNYKYSQTILLPYCI